MKTLAVLAFALSAIAVYAAPSGFLMAMVPDPQQPTRKTWPNKVDLSTGQATRLGDYQQFDIKQYGSSGTYNPKLQEVHFIGESLTEANPVGNFMVSLNKDADLEPALRIIQYTGWLSVVRADRQGRVWGFEQPKDGMGQFAAVTVLDLDGGLSDNYANTTVNNFIPANVAVDSANQLAFFASKVGGGVNLITVDLKTRRQTSNVPLQNPGNQRVTLCYDDTSKGLYSLERASGASESTLNLLNPQTGAATKVAAIRGTALQGDCRSGAFFATGTSPGNYLAIVSLPSGTVDYKNLSVRPDLIVFFPQA